jgi:hypothetical protein
MRNRLANRVKKLEAARGPKQLFVYEVGCDVPKEECERFLERKLGSERDRYLTVGVLSFLEPNLPPGGGPHGLQ